MAGGLGWGIRGQYGHETGAMIAGLLISLVAVLLFYGSALPLDMVRVIGWATIAIGFGGCMTYAQTVGLTHDPALVGNGAALRWGLCGLAVKGGLWFGFFGIFLGMGLGGARYRPLELGALMIVLLGLFLVGVWCCNTPFEPAHKILPKIYFSADWRWRPEVAELKPRREVWGGLLFACAALIIYARWWRGDRLAWNLGLWAVLGGAVGFPLGQGLQAFHAWNRDFVLQGLGAAWDSRINWWNFMETTFGAVAGGMVGFGLWRNRRLIAVPRSSSAGSVMKALLEWPLLAVHVALLMLAEFGDWPPVAFYTEFSLVLGLIPMVLIAGGKWSPFLLPLPITLLPVAGKTLRELCYKQPIFDPWLGWLFLLIIPVGLMGWGAVLWARQQDQGAAGKSRLPGVLLLATWCYFYLNFAFFRFPWPWSEWTYRTPNAVVFFLCSLGLSLAGIRSIPELFRRSPNQIR